MLKRSLVAEYAMDVDGGDPFDSHYLRAGGVSPLDSDSSLRYTERFAE